MSATKVTRNYQITIPAKIRKLLHLEEGMIVDFEVKNGIVILKPKVLVDGSQSWFWTKEWQEGEKEAEEDKRKGRVKRFKSVKDMRGYFEKKKK